MIRRRAWGWCILLVGVLALQPAVARAQRQRAANGVTAALERVQFRVISGRIRATTDHPGGRLNFSSKTLGREENLSLDISSGSPAIDYVCATRTSRLTINVTEEEHVHVRVEPTSASDLPAVDFVQSPDAALVLTVTEQNQTRELRGASLWHLMLADPALCERTLLPPLDLLRRGWRLGDTAAEIEQALVTAAQTARVPDRSQIDALVRQLGDEQFARRQAADHALREQGQIVLPYLEGLDPDRLDAEQRFRVRRILASLAAMGDEDNATRTVTWLIGDPRIWLALAGRDQLETRQVAAAQLTRLLGRPVAFDPLASGEVRAAELETLRGQLAPAAVEK